MDTASDPITTKRPGAGPSRVSLEWKLAGTAYVVGFVALLAIFFDTVATTTSTWIYSRTFNHGLLIPLLIGYLVWRQRHFLAKVQPRFEPLGLILIGLALVVWLVGRISATTIIQQLALVLLIQSYTFCVLGRRVVRLLIFPVAYLIFAIPFGEELVPYLQDVTAFFVVFFLRQVGIPVFIDGVFIATPAGNYLVAEACAGLRYLISTIALGTVFAHLAFRARWRQALFIALSVTVPVFANGVRAFLIVFIAYVSDNEIATGVDHIVYGWIFFSLVTFMLLGIGFLMREPHHVLHAPPERLPPPEPRRPAWPSVAAAMAVVAVAFAVSARADRVLLPSHETDLARVTLPVVPGFTQVDRTEVRWQPEFAGADRQLGQIYRADGRSIAVDVGLYTHERRGAKAVTAEHVFVDGERWKAGDAATVEVAIDDRPMILRSLRLTAAGRYRLVWYWYWVGGEFTGNPYTAKWLQTRTLLAGGNPAVGIVAISTEYVSSAGDPSELLGGFLANLPSLKAALSQAVQG